MRTNKCIATDCSRSVKNNEFLCSVHKQKYLYPIKKNWNIGENNPRWNGGVSYFNNHHLVKKHRKILLKERGLNCQKCNKKCDSSDLHQHHIDGNKNNHSDKNILLLCASCHGRMKKGMTYKKGNSISHWADILGVNKHTLYINIRKISDSGKISYMAALGWIIFEANNKGIK